MGVEPRPFWIRLAESTAQLIFHSTVMTPFMINQCPGKVQI
jgi:hypothetical protein